MFINKKNKDDDIIFLDFEEDNHHNFIKYIIIGAAILIIIIFIFIVKAQVTKKTTYNIELKGDREITIYVGTEFIDPGYTTYDNYGRDNTGKTRVISTIDTNKIGTYEIAYIIGTTIETRKINVIKEKESKTIIHLRGKSIEYYEQGVEYQEEGYIAMDSIDGDITDKVVVSGNIDSNTIGPQKIVYSVQNSKGIFTSVTRTIIMSKSSIVLTLDNDNYTRSNVIINMGIIDNMFSYAILPNGEKIESKVYQYEVSENGTYTFIKYNQNGQKIEANIKVKNIDRKAPTGSCKAEVGENTKITVDAKDDSGIKYYKYNEKNYYSNVFTINGKISSAVVKVYDNADNEIEMTCSIKNITVNPPKTSSSVAPKPSSSVAPKPSSSVAPKPSSSVAPKPSSSSTPKPSSSVAPKPSSSSKPPSGNYVSPSGKPIPFINGVQRGLKTGDCMKWSDNCFCPTIGALRSFQFIMESKTGRNMKETKRSSGDKIVKATVTCKDGETLKALVTERVKPNYIRAFNKICELREQGIVNNNNYKSQGSLNERTTTGRSRCSFHAYGTAIDINADYSVKVNGTTYYPYGRNRSTYEKFVKALGKENDNRNINYILWKKAFEPNGFVWGGNWTTDYDGMHFEIRNVN